MPRLKVCGITDAAFAVEAARRGVDCLGLIFAESSPRRVTVEQAKAVVAAVTEWARSCATMPPPRFAGVFASHRAEEVARIAQAARLDVIQLHGNYRAEDVTALKAGGYEVWRLFGDTDDDDGHRAHEIADAVLLDGRKGTQCGGTGVPADWSLVEPLKRAGRQVVLAGGISAANVAAAVATGADIIDVNSSLEISPGRKSVRLLDEFLASMPRRNMVK